MKRSSGQFGRSAIAIVAAVVAMAATWSCGCPDASTVSTELVLREGARIDVTAAARRMSIIAGKHLQRRYEWGGCGLSAHPCARLKRWYGSLGIYDPAPGLEYAFSSCNQVQRPVVEEGQMHFADQTEADNWVSRYANIYPESTVWKSDGLLISWGVVPERAQLNASVWQVCISGHKPVTLAGSKDDAITVIPASGQLSGRFDCAQVSDDVIAETREVWAEHWRQADEWAARKKTLRQ